MKIMEAMEMFKEDPWSSYSWLMSLMLLSLV